MAGVVVRPGQVKLYPGQPILWTLEDSGPLRDLERRAALVKAGARARVRRRTGLLYSTIRANNGANARGPFVDIIAGKKGLRYAMIEHDGSAPHVIRPRRRKALRFVVGGRVVFAGKVMHPGTTGTRYLLDSLPLARG